MAIPFQLQGYGSREAVDQFLGGLQLTQGWLTVDEADRDRLSLEADLYIDMAPMLLGGGHYDGTALFEEQAFPRCDLVGATGVVLPENEIPVAVFRAKGYQAFYMSQNPSLFKPSRKPVAVNVKGVNINFGDKTGPDMISPLAVGLLRRWMNIVESNSVGNASVVRT